MRWFLFALAFATSHAWGAGEVPAVQRFHRYDAALASGGQPKREQFAALAAAGYSAVVNVAAQDSNPDALRDEKQLVESAGMEYHFIPMNWDKPDVDQLVAAVDRIEKLDGKPVFIHCYVNSRASLVAYLYRVTRKAAPAASERATMLGIWRQNRGYEFENSPQWQFAEEDALKRLRR